MKTSRFISLLLCVVMIMSLFTGLAGSASAAGASVAAGVSAALGVEELPQAVRSARLIASTRRIARVFFIFISSIL